MTAPRPDSLLPVEVQGTLRLDTPGGQALALVADGDVLRLALPGWREARSLMPRSFRERRQALHAIARTLSLYGLSLSLEFRGQPVIGLGHQTRPSWLARILGLAPAHIRFSAIRLLWPRGRA